MKKKWSLTSLKGILTQNRVKQLVCIVLVVAIVLGISVVALASSYHYGVFKMGTLTGYNRTTSSWVTSAGSIAVGALTGTYKWGMDYYKPGAEGQYLIPQVRARYDSYAHTGSDDDFVSHCNAAASSIALKTGNVAPDLINGVAYFTSTKVQLLNDDTAKIQVSFTSNIPISQIIFRAYSFANNTYVGSNIALVEGVDYSVNGNLYVVNYYRPASGVGNFDAFFLTFEAKSSKNAISGATNWDEDYWEIKFNRTLFPFWSKSNLAGNSSGTTNPTGNITNVTYNYMANLDGLYNLMCILLDWQQLDFDAQMMMVQDFQEANQLLSQCWSMLMMLDSDLGIISADVSDILGALYYSPGVTWSQHIYLRLQQIDIDLLNISTGISNLIIAVNNFASANHTDSQSIITLLRSIDGRLNQIEEDLSDILDWLEDLDLENNSHTKTFIETVFEWIKQMLVTVVSVFSIVITIPTLGLITTYNSNGDGILGNEGPVG